MTSGVTPLMKPPSSQVGVNVAFALPQLFNVTVTRTGLLSVISKPIESG